MPGQGVDRPRQGLRGLSPKLLRRAGPPGAADGGQRDAAILCRAALRRTVPVRHCGFYQHLNDHWDLDHPFERLLVDTVVRPDASAVSWINPRLRPGEQRRVMTGIPGKTGVVYTLDRATGEFLWATPTVAQNVISSIDGATGAVSENPELVFGGFGQEVLTCPTAMGGKDWEAGAYSPRTNLMYMPLRNACARMAPLDDGGRSLYSLSMRNELAPGTDQLGAVWPISAETGATAGPTSSARRRCRSRSRPGASSSWATSTAASGRRTTRPATCSGRSTSARR